MKSLNITKIKNLSSISGMPNMSETLTGWEVPLNLVKVVQDVVEGDLFQTEQKIDFKGCWQPLRDEQLELKPEGQRSWQWIWIHAKAGALNLTTADKVIFNNIRYEVMAVKDYSLNGFIEYQLVEDYTDEQ